MRAVSLCACPRSRPRRCLPKADQFCRSTSHALEVLPGPPTAARLDPDRPETGVGAQLAATNGADARGRTLLAGAAVQLRDAFGNTSAIDGVPVRWLLTWPSPGDDDEDGGGPGPGPGSREAAEAAGAALPQLQASSLGAQQGVTDEAAWLEAATDGRGRAFFGDLCVVQVRWGWWRVGQDGR